MKKERTRKHPLDKKAAKGVRKSEMGNVKKIEERETWLCERERDRMRARNRKTEMKKRG